jgi:IclR family acetate operon transcriptional repressor
MVVVDAAVTQVCNGRGVLEGAFEILDALGRADAGLGLTELANATGLAKTTVRRLAEQLVAVGAAQRIERRYFVGPTIARLGRCWQPDPQLRQAACGPIRTLAAFAHTAAAVYVVHERRAHLVTAAVCRGHSWLPPGDLDAESIPHTAVGRVLLTTQDTGGGGGAIAVGQWRHQLDLRDWRAVVTDDPKASQGICWVAAPVWRPDGRCAAAVAALVVAPTVLPGLKDRVVCAAGQIGQNLRQESPSMHGGRNGMPDGTRRAPRQIMEGQS